MRGEGFEPSRDVPGRAREQGREEDAETDPLFHIPTDSYSIINPVDVYGPLEESSARRLSTGRRLAT